MPFANTDSKTLAHFASMANSWWDPNGNCAPLHHLNPVRLSFVQSHLDLKQANILDVGCGGGILSESLHHHGARVTALDACQAAIDAACQHAGKLDIDYHCTTAEAWQVVNTTNYDAITCMELLEHVPCPASLIQCCADMLKPNGLIFFSTLNRTALAYLFAILGSEYLTSLLPRGTHDYQQFIKPSELASWARAAKLQLLDLRGIRYQPFLKRASLCSAVAVNYICVFKRQ